MKNDLLIKKIASYVLIAAAVLMLFPGWITVTGNSHAVKNAVDELDDAVDEWDDELDYIEDELDDLDLNIKPKKLLKSFEKTYDALKDLSISPREFGTLRSFTSKIYRILKRANESRLYGWYSYDDSVLVLFILKWWLLFASLLFIAALAVSVLVLVFHVMNKKTAGYYLIIPYAFLGIICIASVIIIDIIAITGNGSDMLLRPTFAPFLAIIFSIASCVCWSFAQKGTVQSPSIQYGSANIPYSGSNRVCKNCGTPLADEVVFCPNCGANTASQQQDANAVFCPNCGQSIPAETVFCPNCGNKV